MASYYQSAELWFYKAMCIPVPLAVQASKSESLHEALQALLEDSSEVAGIQEVLRLQCLLRFLFSHDIE